MIIVLFLFDVDSKLIMAFFQDGYTVQRPVTQQIWTPQIRFASRYGPPFADLEPPENKHSFDSFF